jgi:protein-tyrosine phosphatase
VTIGARTLTVDGLVNARDLGGLPLTRGGHTPTGVFYRSENLDTVTTTGWDQLHAAGIRTVVDLRQPGERARDRQSRPTWLTTHHVDLDGLDDQRFWSGYWDNGLVGTALYYLPHLTAMPQRTGAALTALAHAGDGGVLFHCMQGRDRTGMIAMILLAIAGTEPDAIVEDYLHTVRLGDLRATTTGRANDEPRIEQFLAGHATTTEQAFRDALTGLDLPTLWDTTGISHTTRQLLHTWRGRLPH